MASFNQIIIIGNLTRAPELRVTQKGTSICQFGIAASREYKAGDGNKGEEALFIDCEVWGNGADVIAKYMTKGRPIFIQGRLKTESWEDKQSGQRRSKTKVVVENFQFVGGKDGAAHGQPQRSEDGWARSDHAPSKNNNTDDDVKF